MCLTRPQAFSKLAFIGRLARCCASHWLDAKSTRLKNLALRSCRTNYHFHPADISVQNGWRKKAVCGLLNQKTDVPVSLLAKAQFSILQFIIELENMALYVRNRKKSFSKTIGQKLRFEITTDHLWGNTNQWNFEYIQAKLEDCIGFPDKCSIQFHCVCITNKRSTAQESIAYSALLESNWMRTSTVRYIWTAIRAGKTRFFVLKPWIYDISSL